MVIRLLRISTKKITFDDIARARDAIHTDRIALCSTIAISAGEMIGRMQNSPSAYLRMRANSARSKIAPPDSYIRNSSTSSDTNTEHTIASNVTKRHGAIQRGKRL